MNVRNVRRAKPPHVSHCNPYRIFDFVHLQHSFRLIDKIVPISGMFKNLDYNTQNGGIVIL
jgi:hypothetical protein